MRSLQNHGNNIDEEYMTEAHLHYFKEKLINWRDELTGNSDHILNSLKEVDMRKPDPVDCGSLYAEKERNIITTSRNNYLIQQIEHALRCIRNKEYGYCQLTGERIGMKRLEIMPLATLSIEAQEDLERKGSLFRL